MDFKLAVGNKHGSFLRINVANCGMGGEGALRIYMIFQQIFMNKKLPS